jgi:hypothetical protein
MNGIGIKCLKVLSKTLCALCSKCFFRINYRAKAAQHRTPSDFLLRRQAMFSRAKSPVSRFIASITFLFVTSTAPPATATTSSSTILKKPVKFQNFTEAILPNGQDLRTDFGLPG